MGDAHTDLPRFWRAGLACLAVVLVSLFALPPPVLAETVYRWVDEAGVLHLSSEKPPKGVKAERITVRSKPSASGSAAGSRAGAASPGQIAARREVLGKLQLRECVIALESLDALTSGTRATDTAELKRVQQTVDRNCSKNPEMRRTQEQMAAKLKSANSPDCVRAREQLAILLDTDNAGELDEVRRQQTFVADHCTPPVR
jgi:hypothetical protein